MTNVIDLVDSSDNQGPIKFSLTQFLNLIQRHLGPQPKITVNISQKPYHDSNCYKKIQLKTDHNFFDKIWTIVDIQNTSSINLKFYSFILINNNQEDKFILNRNYLNNLCVRNQFIIRLNQAIPKRFEIHRSRNYFSPYISTLQIYRFLLGWLKRIQNFFDEIHHQIYQRLIINQMPDDWKKEARVQKIISPLRKSASIFIDYRNIKEVLKRQNKQHYFIKDQNKKVKSKVQILRSVNFFSKKPLKSVILKHNGAYSEIRLIQSYGSIIDTYKMQKLGPDKQKQYDSIISKQGKLQLLQKTYTNKDGAKQSFQNQFKFLNHIVGSSTSKYSCSYYINGTDTDKLYMDYHRHTAKSYFVQDPNDKQKQVRMDFRQYINFIQKVLQGLIDIYLSRHFIHRDIKLENILISSQGIIKIIDSGSIFPLASADPNNIKQFLIHFDSELRTSHIITPDMFTSDKRLALKYYKNGYYDFSTYLLNNSQSENFDCYSLGVMLSNLRKVHKQHPSFKQMQVKGRIKNFLGLMTKLDFSERISVKQALRLIKKIKKELFYV